MLPNGAHISLTVNGETTSFLLDESYDTIYRYHYVHNISPLVIGSDVVVGSKNERSTRPDRLFWTYEDWSGGEGPPNYDPSKPNVYYRSTGGTHPRYRGQLTASPTGTNVVLASLDFDLTPVATNAVGLAWIVCGNRTYHSDDGVTWAAGPTLPSGNVAYSAAGSEDFLYVSTLEGDGTRSLYRTNAGPKSQNPGPTLVINETTQTSPHLGLTCWLDGKVYGWTGRNLVSYDVNNDLPLTAAQHRTVFNNGVDIAEATFYADMTTESGTLFFMTSTIGDTRVWQRSGAGKNTLCWRPGGVGFTGRTITNSNGNIVVAGHYGGESRNTGRGTVYGLDLATRQPANLTWVRRDSEHAHVTTSAASYGPDILLGTDEGEVFVYDFSTDGLSQLGTPGGPRRIHDLLTFRDRRLVVWVDPPPAIQQLGVMHFPDDDPANRGVRIYPTDTPNHDFFLPFDTKELVGFHVSFVPLTSAQTITISYQLDDSGTWVPLTAISSSTTGNSIGRAFLQVSDSDDTVGFFKMKFRVEGLATSGLAPVVMAVTAESKTLAYEETWELAIRIRDESAETRVSDTERSAEQIRDVLLDAAINKTVVTLKDGYRYKHEYKQEDGSVGYTTHTCTIEGVDDHLVKQAEGPMIVKLKAIPV